MSEPVKILNRITVDIGQWIERAKADPLAYMERQATEVFLAALGMTEPYSHEIFLKGGILMGVVYDSPRNTGDIDFTAISDPNPEIADQLKIAINQALPRAAAKLGYPDLLCAIQSAKYYPSATKFSKAIGPALKINVGYAKRGSAQEKHFKQGKASNVLEVDISFREPVHAIQIIQLGDHGGAFAGYSLLDLIAEKLRALLQQIKRNRNRRQDIYDIASLLQKFALDEKEKHDLLELMREKCKARDIDPDVESFSHPEIRDRARKEWDTLELEIGELPDFDECFDQVDAFYRSLPWGTRVRTH